MLAATEAPTGNTPVRIQPCRRFMDLMAMRIRWHEILIILAVVLWVARPRGVEPPPQDHRFDDLLARYEQAHKIPVSINRVFEFQSIKNAAIELLDGLPEGEAVQQLTEDCDEKIRDTQEQMRHRRA